MAVRSELKYDPNSHYEVSVYDVEYRRDGDEVRLARIYQPKGTGPFPALVDAHGGVWSMGNRLADELIDSELAASGLVVAALDLRTAPKHTHPAQVEDVNYATRWLKARASEFSVAADFIGGIGASSGGHIVMLSAMRPHDPRYNTHPLPEPADVDATLAYVVALWPVIDPYARHQYAKETGRSELVARGEGYFLTEDAMQEASPQLILERHEKVGMPPTLVIAPDPDENVPKSIFERFVSTYRGAGGNIEIEWFPGAYHGFGRERSPNTERALAVTKAFISRQLEGAKTSV